MPRFKTALLGFPADAGPRLAAALKNLDLLPSAVCEEDPARLAAAEKLLPEAALYRDQERFFSLSGGFDLAVIAGPADGRPRAARRCLENRLHAACLTPFCSSTSEFEDLRGAAASAQRALFPLQPWERSAAWRAVEKALDGGMLGETDFAEVQDLSAGPAPEGGAAAARAWRAYALLLAALRRPPRALEARLSGEKGAETAVTAHVHFGGADGFLRAACGRHAPLFKFSVHGELGRLELEGPELRLDIKGLPPETVKFRRGLEPDADTAERFSGELEALLLEMEGKSPAGSGLRNARYCAKLLKNTYYSAAVRSAAVPL
jgi:predicted dehydrogenase